MRFINVLTFEVQEFLGKWPPYGILSHTWDNDEVSLQDIRILDQAKCKGGFRKIEWCCSQALQDKLDYVWVDTCCIDKTSSAELTEAINSMYQLYKSATVCYAYLADVTIDEKKDMHSILTFNPSRYRDTQSITSAPHLTSDFLASFRLSRWFTRGWTLQELIAPTHMVFYDRKWSWIEHRSTLIATIVEATGIDLFAFTARNLHSYSIAQKFSWAARRRTTRIEDEAYCLLGILDINMPLLYGEGRKAFQRLQQEVIKQTHDHSIFVWTAKPGDVQGLLAPEPSRFIYSNDIVRTTPPPGSEVDSYTFGNRGLSIRLPCLCKETARASTNAVPVVRDTDAKRTVIALLNCRPKSQFLGWLGLELREPEEMGGLWTVVGTESRSRELVSGDLAAKAKAKNLLIQPQGWTPRANPSFSYVSTKIFVNLSHHPLATSKAIIWAYPSNQWNESAGFMELGHDPTLDFGAVLMDLEADRKVVNGSSSDRRSYLFIGFTRSSSRVGIVNAELVTYQDWTTFWQRSNRLQQWFQSIPLEPDRVAQLRKQVRVSDQVTIHQYGLKFQGDHALVLKVQVRASEAVKMFSRGNPSAGGRFEPPRSKATSEGFLSLDSPVWSLDRHCMDDRKNIVHM